MSTVRLWLTMACAVAATLAGAASASAALSDVPTPTVTGPIPVTASSHPFLASDLDLAAHGYTEKEYYLSGDATKYTTPTGLVSSTKVLDGPNAGLYPYRTRIVVRRPIDPARFNGTTLLEWQNVTAGFDIEWNWFNDPQYLMDHGYAWVGVSAQRTGVNALKSWNPARYGDLDVSSTATPADILSYDVFSQAAKAVRGFASGRDPMGGLEATTVIASGESQSGSRLNSYYNGIQQTANVVDGFFITVAGGTLRTDLTSAKVMRVLSEREVSTRPATPEADGDTLRHWEIAGGSHLPYVAYAHWAPVATRDLGTQSADCVKPALSRVQWPYVANRALDALVRWQKGGAAPAIAPRAQYAGETTGAALQRDADGNGLGGIRLPALTVPVATESSINSAAPGTVNPFSAFCGLLGSSTPFAYDALTARYADYGDYVERTNAAAEALRGGAFLTDGGIDQIKADAADFTRLRPTAPALGVDSRAVNAGTFALTWRGPSAITTDTRYGVQARSSAPGAAWADVPGATAVAARSVELSGPGPLAEGTYAFRVRGTTNTLATPVEASRVEVTPWSDALTGIAVDRTAPPAPTVAADRPPEWAGDGGWFRDAVNVSVTAGADPLLADGSPGSGVDPASLPGGTSRSTTGPVSVVGTATDRAGNVSPVAAFAAHVDAQAPDLTLTCPVSAWVGDPAVAVASAADGGSGLATPAVETVPIDTATAGTRTVSRTAVDRVGHAVEASCSTVVRALPGIGAPGATGEKGDRGAIGAPGKAGARGPRGRSVKVTCRTTGRSRVKVTCRVTRAGKAHTTRVVLSRGGRTVATRTWRASSGAVSVTSRRALARGRYTLTVTTRDADGTSTSRSAVVV